MNLTDFLGGVGTGLAGGLMSGLFGVSPGGGLVVLSVFLLGAEQHVAQGISLVAQVPPTSAWGIGRYWAAGERAPLRWLVLLAVGFLVGGAAGALAANLAAAATLQWSYVAYLAVLDVMLIMRGRGRQSPGEAAGKSRELHGGALLAVGLLAGLSSGFLGIGGGLATVIGLGVVLGVPQHQAQMISLMLSLVPTTIPSAWVYWRSGAMASWPTLAGVILGLIVGTDLGARLATRITPVVLKRSLILFLSLMVIGMAFKALA
ncbi:sulfite exporter TauE/SafE family protein [Bradyrhizobium sp. HKCCYLS1011]|uniref:sulfite exporter TauE/SafE family protein n=1 Tax=Bradyrhizobium sp. HKCCYLS1011 TaxID=3420733 RepID=UPI003EB7E987